MYFDYSILANDDGKVFEVNTTNEPVYLQLPSPTTGFKITIKDAIGTASVNPIYINRQLSPALSTIVTNGTFDTDISGWTANGTMIATWSAGAAHIARNGSSSAFYQTMTTVVGRVYNVSFQNLTTVAAAGTLEFFIKDGVATSPVGGTNLATKSAITAAGIYTVSFTAISTQATILFNLETQAAAATDIDNVSVTSDAIPSTDKIDGEVNDDIIDKNFGAISYVSDGIQWYRISSNNSNIPIGLFGGGTTGAVSSVIDYINLSSQNNAINFGNLTVARNTTAAFSSSTRGLFAGGTTGSASNVIDYVTISILGNAVSFGSLTVARSSAGGCSNATRGLAGGGSGPSSVIDFVIMSNISNATSFGSLSLARTSAGSCASPVRGLWGGGDNGSSSAVIDYVTISTTGNATSFGSLTNGPRTSMCGCSNANIGIFAGGGNVLDTVFVSAIDYVTIATTGNSTNFGNLSVARSSLGACASTIKGIFSGGNTGAVTTIIDYVNIATTGNSTFFGSLTVARRGLAGCSNAHGGLSV